MRGASGRRSKGFVRRYGVFGITLMVVLSAIALAAAVHGGNGEGSCNPAPHASILIQTDKDFTSANGVVAGKGTASNPYVIMNLQFKDLSAGYGLKIDNTKGHITKYFTVTCVQSSFTVSPPDGAPLVWILSIHTSTTISSVTSNSGEANGSIGIRVDGSSGITLSNENINKYGSDGVQLNGSDHITVIASKLKASGNGVSIVNSHDITIGQTCNLASAQGCNEFTYDDGRGIWIENSYNVLVLNTITGADDTGGILIDGKGSYGITLLNGTASGNGPICPSGTPTGEVSDTIAGISASNGAHDITVHGYTVNANGDGAGGFFDLMNGGNGLYLNPCTGAISSVPKSAPGGANLDFNGNCYHFEFGFTPAPTVSCPGS